MIYQIKDCFGKKQQIYTTTTNDKNETKINKI